MASPPIRALIIDPDDSYELKTVEQDIEVFQRLVGGMGRSHPDRLLGSFVLTAIVYPTAMTEN